MRKLSTENSRAMKLKGLKIVNRFLRKNPQMVKNVKSEIARRKRGKWQRKNEPENGKKREKERRKGVKLKRNREYLWVERNTNSD